MFVLSRIKMGYFIQIFLQVPTSGYVSWIKKKKKKKKIEENKINL